MKEELSIEKKAEAYDERLAKARKEYSIHEANNAIGIMDALERVFPELKESEDERIKEWLINLVKGHIEWLEDRIREQLSNGQVYGDELVKAKNSIAWLEKQGKEEYALKSSKDEDVRKFMEYIEKQAKAYEFNLPNRGYDIYAFSKDILTWLEKQGEQKPAELSNSCEFSIKTWINIVVYVLKEHNGIGNYLDDPEVKDTAEKLQKRYKFDSASEEWDDEKKEPKKIKQTYTNNQFTLEQASILDRHIDKFLEENPAWSEEDEKMFNSALWHVKNSCSNGGKNSGEFEVYNWLKSLRPQNRWKPSDEQMGALANACDGKILNLDYLNSLYQDLKKLREG